MKNPRFGDLPFTLLRLPENKQVARYICARCGGHADLPVVRHGRNMTPDGTMKRAIEAGWKLRGTRAECPRCQAATERRKGESPAPKPPAPGPASAPPAVATLATVATVATPAQTGEVIQMADPTKLRDATPAEKVKIRAILDGRFDDAAGAWLDGYSDQKAGEELGIPWAMVTRIREAAYGPIRVDPEMVGLRAEMAQLGRDIAALRERHDAAIKRMEALLAKRAA